jgi:alpha-beta hydrolase superfamily lysophospholipase
MPFIEESISTADGTRLYVRRREAKGARGEVIILHGFGEHSGRYTELIRHLNDTGYSVTAYDQRGHGQSDGLPGHVDRFTHYEADLAQVITSVRARAHSSNTFLIAHSMGGLVACRYLAGESVKLTGAVISAPLIAVASPVPAHKVMIARVGGRVAPRLRLDNGINPAVLSRDPEVGRAYAADPLVNRLVSTRWFAEAMGAMDEVRGRAARITLPVLVMHGTEDRLTSLSATREFFDGIGSADKELVVYPGYYHELFNEPEKRQVYERVTDWIDAHITPIRKTAAF